MRYVEDETKPANRRIRTVRSDHNERRASDLDFLKIIPPDLKLFDNISVSSGQESDLSGQFSEYETGDGFSEKRKSDELKKTDLYSYFSFSEEFRCAMESVKSGTRPSADEYSVEEAGELEPSAKESEIQKELHRKAEELLRETKFFGHERQKLTENDETKSGANPDPLKVVRKPKGKEEKTKIYDEEDYFDTMSGYWRMLSAYDEFKISHPDFNAYENEKPHWLETKPIPLEITENSRNKCLEWLKENFEKY